MLAPSVSMTVFFVATAVRAPSVSSVTPWFTLLLQHPQEPQRAPTLPSPTLPRGGGIMGWVDIPHSKRHIPHRFIPARSPP